MSEELVLNARKGDLLNPQHILVDSAISNDVLLGFSLIELEPIKAIVSLGTGIYRRYLLLGAGENANKIFMLDGSMKNIADVALAYTRFYDEVAVEIKVDNKTLYFRTNYGSQYSKTITYTKDTFILSSKTTSIGSGYASLSGSISSAEMVIDGVTRTVRSISSEACGVSNTISPNVPSESHIQIGVYKLGSTTAPRVLNAETGSNVTNAYFKMPSVYKKAWGEWAGAGEDTRGGYWKVLRELNEQIWLETAKHPWRATLPLNRSTQRKSLIYMVKADAGNLTKVEFDNADKVINVFESEESRTEEDSPKKDEIKRKLLWGGVKGALVVNTQTDGTYTGVAEIKPLQDFGNVFIEATLPIEPEPIPAS